MIESLEYFKACFLTSSQCSERKQAKMKKSRSLSRSCGANFSSVRKVPSYVTASRESVASGNVTLAPRFSRVKAAAPVSRRTGIGASVRARS